MASLLSERYMAVWTGSASRDIVALVARVLLVPLFLMSGFGKITDFAGTTAHIDAQGLPLPMLGVLIAIAVEVGCAFLVLIGWKARWAALAITSFSIVSGVFFHAYWNDTGSVARMVNYTNFWKNISIAGGFLMLFAFGPGRYSVDHA